MSKSPTGDPLLSHSLGSWALLNWICPCSMTAPWASCMVGLSAWWASILWSRLHASQADEGKWGGQHELWQISSFPSNYKLLLEADLKGAFIVCGLVDPPHLSSCSFLLWVVLVNSGLKIIQRMTYVGQGCQQSLLCPGDIQDNLLSEWISWHSWPLPALDQQWEDNLK